MTLGHLTIAEAARLIERKELSPVELAGHFLDRIEKLDGRLNSVITLLAEEALQNARTAEKEISEGRYKGPLHGIPLGLKDVYDTAGILTTGNSNVYRDRIPRQDSAVAARLKTAGGILLGKMNTHELALGGPSFELPWPPPRNPWAADGHHYFTGGSSSGSAVAVAAGLVLGAMGTDTGGSIRHPAAQCGIVGLRPTLGRVSNRGVIPVAFSLDCCGPMTWTVRDNALILRAVAGYDALDANTADRPVPDYASALTGNIRGKRIGLIRHFFDGDVTVAEEVRDAIEAAAGEFEKLGATVEEVRLSPLQDYTAACWIILASEAYALHETELKLRLYEFCEDFRIKVLGGALFRAVDYIQAQRRRRELTIEMGTILTRFDALLSATVPIPPPRIEAVTLTQAIAQRPITSAFSLTGLPVLAQCCGFSASGLPLSMSLVGRPFDEVTILALADAYERATPWRRRRPPLDD